MVDFDRLNNLIKERGITKAFIATRLGRQRQLLNNWEHGKSQPSKQDLYTIAEILGTNVEYLTGESDQKIRIIQIREELSSKIKRVLNETSDLNEDELAEVLDHIAYVKSKRKKQQKN